MFAANELATTPHPRWPARHRPSGKPARSRSSASRSVSRTSNRGKEILQPDLQQGDLPLVDFFPDRHRASSQGLSTPSPKRRRRDEETQVRCMLFRGRTLGLDRPWRLRWSSGCSSRRGLAYYASKRSGATPRHPGKTNSTSEGADPNPHECPATPCRMPSPSLSPGRKRSCRSRRRQRLSGDAQVWDYQVNGYGDQQLLKAGTRELLQAVATKSTRAAWAIHWRLLPASVVRLRRRLAGRDSRRRPWMRRSASPPPRPKTIVVDYSSPNVAAQCIGASSVDRHRRKSRAIIGWLGTGQGDNYLAIGAPSSA